MLLGWELGRGRQVGPQYSSLPRTAPQLSCDAPRPRYREGVTPAMELLLGPNTIILLCNEARGRLTRV